MTLAHRKRLAPATRFVCEWTSIRALAQQKERWRALAEAAAEPNPFYSADYLMASSHEVEQADIPCVAILRDGTRDAELLGLSR